MYGCKLLWALSDPVSLELNGSEFAVVPLAGLVVLSGIVTVWVCAPALWVPTALPMLEPLPFGTVLCFEEPDAQ